MLDLGVWMSIQSKVENVHHRRRCQVDALCRSIEDAWENHLLEDAFANVFSRLRVVLSLIVEDNGGNELVEKKRGKLFCDASLPLLPQSEGDETEEDKEDNLLMDLEEQLSDDEELL